MAETNGHTNQGDASSPDFDVVVVGAGFAGLYLLHRLRNAGMSAKAFETGEDVGGTWFWNRYPGARCDIATVDYSYSFDPELEEEWEWSEKYATQPEILRYLNLVADKHDLRRDIQFETKVEKASWDDAASLWRLTTSSGDEVSCRHYVMATGCLSQPKAPEIAGHDSFGGDVYYTSRWPHEGADFTGKRVGVIGTGSSGIQSIPIMAKQASELTVFQRTANFSFPALNGPPDAEAKADLLADRAAYRESARWSQAGVPLPVPEIGALMMSDEDLEAALERAWAAGALFGFAREFNDIMVSEAANELCAEFVRNKIRSIVHDPATAEKLCPNNHPLGTKRPCLDSGYFETFNLSHVSLIDLKADPISSITSTGIDTASGSHEFDAIVFATGFDAMTGAIVAVDIEGRGGVRLKDKWADGPQTYLGLNTKDFPNVFMVTGPGSPSVLSNMAVSIEQHVDWIVDTLMQMRDEGFDVIEPTETAEAGWGVHVNDCADLTLFSQADSWYMGANVPGKPRVILPYLGGVDVYRQTCNDVTAQGFLGYRLEGDGKVQENDGVIQRLQPDVRMVLDFMASMELPPLESMSVDEARGFMAASSEQRPPGPEVGEIVDGTYPAADGSDLEYRLYRPDSAGPHPVVAYFHGGGWVLGDTNSDDPLCRDLCVRTDAIIVSMNYRHAPEARFPAAADDAFAAVSWVAENAESLGGMPGRLAVCGWSAGANVAAVACQTARDAGAGGPEISGQVLLTPVTDCDFSRASYTENADGYVLTRALMDWFWDHYADEADRADPKASPIRAADLSGLPPALIVAAEFDPLRDEGLAYVEALKAAGVDAQSLFARGHTHTSVGSVDIVLSGADIRAEMANALRQFLGSPISV